MFGLLALATPFLGLVHAASSTVTVDVSPNAKDAGPSLSQTLLPSFAGMGIEPSNLLAFTGTQSVNPLSYQLLANLGNYTGVPPHLRIGGNTGDDMLYDDRSTSYSLVTNHTGSKTSNWYYGSQFFDALDRMPPGTPITFGLNLAYNGSDATDRIVDQAAAVLDNLHNVQVAGFEVGNEPDLYVTNNYRPSDYSEQDYGREWLQRVQAIHNQVLAPRNRSSSFFEIAVTATTADQNGHPYRISNLVQDNEGVASANGIYISGFNQHDYLYYIDVSQFPITMDWLLDTTNTQSQFSEWVSQANQAKEVGKPYYLREMGSIGPEGIKGLSDTFANTLWTFNFFLYAATVQVSSVQIHMTQTSYSSPWQPIPANGRAAHVRSSYYAFAAIAQLIGTKCNTRVASLGLNGQPSGYHGRLIAYSIYSDDALSGLALVNTKTSNISSPTGNSIDFTFTQSSLAGKTFYLSALTAAGTDATQNTTWNGMSYEQHADGKSTPVKNNTVQTTKADQSGSITISVPDGSAIVANLNSPLGSDTTVDKSKCASLSQSGEAPDANPSGTGGNPAPTFSSTSIGSGHKLSTGDIIAIAVAVPCGVIAILAAVAVTTFLLCRRRRRQRAASAAAAAPIAGTGRTSDEARDLEQIGAPRYSSSPLYGSDNQLYAPEGARYHARNSSASPVDSALYAPPQHPPY